MGIAAYNRGSIAIQNQIRAEMPSAEMMTLRDLDAVSRAKGTAQLFQGTVIRHDGRHWWLMDRPEEGWASFGYRYNTLWEIADRYALRFVSFGRDRCSAIVTVEPRREGE